MKIRYIVPDKYNNTVTVTMNEDYIIYNYWDYWKKRMIERYGEDSELITKENCIKDYMVIHWAWEE